MICIAGRQRCPTFPTFSYFWVIFLLFGKCPTFDQKFLLFPTFETFFLLFLKYSEKLYKITPIPLKHRSKPWIGPKFRRYAALLSSSMLPCELSHVWLFIHTTLVARVSSYVLNIGNSTFSYKFSNNIKTSPKAQGRAKISLLRGTFVLNATYWTFACLIVHSCNIQRNISPFQVNRKTLWNALICITYA